VAASRYRIVLRGRLSERFESAFDGMTLEYGPNRTVLVGDVRDQAQLYGLLDRLQEFGIELLAVEPADVSDGSCERGAGLLPLQRHFVILHAAQPGRTATSKVREGGAQVVADSAARFMLGNGAQVAHSAARFMLRVRTCSLPTLGSGGCRR
jgi:hypothetical protein